MGSRDEEFTAFVVQRRGQLFRAACLLTGGDTALAEDVVQQTLTRLYVAWHRVARADSPDAYARRALVNAHLDERRRPWRRERPTPAEAGSQLDVPQPDDTSYDDVSALWSALRALAPGQRRAVVLRHYLGLSVEETATDLGVSTGTVKSQTSAGLARLRVALSSASQGSEPR